MRLAKIGLFLGLAVSTQVARAANVDLASAIKIPVEKYQLANGLTVILHADSTSPMVDVQTWYKVGSKDEVPGRTGLAHFFEHMMFKGTPRFGIDTWARTLKNVGSSYNAATSTDYTNYYIISPSENLPLLLDVESDRMRNLKLDQADVIKEREVVKEERRMRYDDSVDGGIHEEMQASIFRSLPYHWLPIGSMKDLNAASNDDLRAFYRKFYSPGNATLVIAGAFDPARTKQLIERYYGSIPREEVTRPKIESEAAQTKERRIKIDRDAQSPTVAVGYRTVAVAHPDNYALELLSIILGQGQSSRLHHELVYTREMALAAGSFAWGQFLDGIFQIQLNLKNGIVPERALALVESEVEKLRERPVSARELDKARNILMKGYVDGLKKMAGRARTLGTYETYFGDYTRIFSDLKNYQAVTAADIKRVAGQYLKASRRNIVTVMPRQNGSAK